MSSQLPRGMRKVAQFIVEHPVEAASLSINDLAEQSGSSPATINRFCKRLGYGGYLEFRVAVATANGRAEQAQWQQAVGASTQPGDSLERMASIIASRDMQAIQETVDLMDIVALEATVESLARARQVHTFGVVGSYLAAREFGHRLRIIGKAAWSWSDPHDGLAASALLGADDVFVVFSHSGRTKESVQVLESAGRLGVTTVALTNSLASPIAELADHVLVTTVNEGSVFRSEALAARHSQLFIIDLLFVAVANRTYERSLAAYERANQAVTGQLVLPPDHTP